MADTLKIGVVGAGAISQIAHIPIWKRTPGVEVVAICDANKPKAQWVADRFKIPHVLATDEHLFDMDEINLVDVCTPNSTHRPLAIAALSAGKDVIVEKPLAPNFKEASEIVAAARQYERKLMVGMNLRFRPDALTLKDFVTGGELGRIFYAKSGWLLRRERLADKSWYVDKNIAGGGAFMELGTQMLDLNLWLMGAEKVASVKAVSYNLVSGLDVEDSGAAMIQLEDGRTLMVEVSWILSTEKDILYSNLFGTTGSALLNPLRVHKELHGNLVNVTPTRLESSTNLYKKSYENELRHFAECVRDDTPTRSTGEEAVELMRVVDAVYESARSGAEVRLG